MTKVGVCLSGCGFLDGSEIHESVLTLLALDRAGAEVLCMAPDIPQRDVVDHKTGKLTAEKRGVLAEAARIARGKIVDLARVKAGELDALIFPGGFGAAKNLCDFALAAGQARPDDAVAKLVREMHAQMKPIGAVCIAPAMIASVFRGSTAHPKLTIGDDPGTARALESLGARHETCPVTEFRVDEENRIVSTPAYMYDERISRVSQGIERLVGEVLRLARQPVAAR